MRYFSMFTGIGGFEKGIEQAYVNLRPIQSNFPEGTDSEYNIKNESQQWECVGYSEIDKYAIQIYEKHYPEHKNYGSATDIDPTTLPDFDLLVGGFPCQAFSIAGKRRGFEDTRGTLFFDIAKILREKRPRHFILENVKGLLSHDNGNTFKTIISTLAELGYSVEWQVLNSKNFGVPQNRERVFIIGHLGGFGGRQVFPIREASKAALRYYQGDVSGKGYTSQQDRVYTTDGIVGTIPSTRTENKLNIFDYASTQETNARKVLRVLQDQIGKEAFTEWGFGILDSFQQKEVLQPVLYEQGVRVQAEKGQPTMDDGTLSRKEDMPTGELLLLWELENGGSSQEPRLARQFIGELSESLSQLSFPDSSWRIRRLTPKEAERLQGFPDDWTAGVSDTQRYKCCGNAVTVNVVEEVIKRLFSA